MLAVGGRQFSKGTAEFEAGFKATSATSKKVFADPEGQVTKDVLKSRGLDLAWEVCQFNELRGFMQGIQNDSADLHVNYAEEKADCAKQLLKVSAIWVEKAAKEKIIAKFMRPLAGKLSERKRIVVGKRHTKDAVAVRLKLRVQVKQLSVCVTELKGEAGKGKETVTDLTVNLKAAEKFAEDVACKQNDLQARLQ